MKYANLHLGEYKTFTGKPTIGPVTIMLIPKIKAWKVSSSSDCMPIDLYVGKVSLQGTWYATQTALQRNWKNLSFARTFHVLLPQQSLHQLLHLPWLSPGSGLLRRSWIANWNSSMSHSGREQAMAQERAQLQSLSREPFFFLLLEYNRTQFCIKDMQNQVRKN